MGKECNRKGEGQGKERGEKGTERRWKGTYPKDFCLASSLDVEVKLSDEDIDMSTNFRTKIAITSFV